MTLHLLLLNLPGLLHFCFINIVLSVSSASAAFFLFFALFYVKLRPSLMCGGEMKGGSRKEGHPAAWSVLRSLTVEHPDCQTQPPLTSFLLCEPHSLWRWHSPTKKTCRLSMFSVLSLGRSYRQIIIKAVSAFDLLHAPQSAPATLVRAVLDSHKKTTLLSKWRLFR